jgi:hypothetical protein
MGKFLKKLSELRFNGEEDLKEEIENLKKKLSEKEKKLLKIKSNKIVKKKKKKKKKLSLKLFVVLFIFMILLIILPLIFINTKSEEENYIIFKCEKSQINPCIDCKVALSCLNINPYKNRSILSFQIQNRNSILGDCYANISIKTGENKTKEVIYPVGIINPQESIITKREVNINDGFSRINAKAYCSWN